MFLNLVTTQFININNLLILYDKTTVNIKKSGIKVKDIIFDKCKNDKKNILVFPEGKSI